jgi:hypothetical protein
LNKQFTYLQTVEMFAVGGAMEYWSTGVLEFDLVRDMRALPYSTKLQLLEIIHTGLARYA